MKKKILSVALAVSVLFSSWGSAYAADFQSSEDLAVLTEEEQPDAALETLSEETEDFSDEAEISVEEPTEETDSSDSPDEADESELEITFDDEESDEIEITEEDESAEDEIQLEESAEEEEVTDFDDGESEVSAQARKIDPSKVLYYTKLPDGTYSVDGFMESEGAKGTVTIENDSDIIYTKISDSAFEGVNLTKVILPDTITEIGDKAFYNCSSLTSVNTPANLKIIGKEAFSGCNHLEAFDFPKGVEVIKDKAFYNAEWAIDLPESVRKVGSKAFATNRKYRTARNLTIRGNIANLAADAFDGIIVKYLELGKDVEDLPEYLMPGSRDQEVYSELKGVRIDKENSVWSSEDDVWYGAWFDKDRTALLKYPCKRSYVSKYEIPSTVTKIWPYAFQDSQIHEVVIPDSVTSVGTGAFYDCKATSINIPDWMTSIPDYAFAANLKSIEIPESVVKIGEGAFYGCAATSINIPDSVVEIGAKAFYTNSWNHYSSLNIPDSVEKIGEDAFGSKQIDCTITIGRGLKDITNLPEVQAYVVSDENPYFSSEDGVLFNKDKTILKRYPEHKTDTSYKVPDCVTVLESTLRNSNLESVVIGDGVKIIPGACFSCVESIKSVTLGKSVEKVKGNAFLEMSALETLVINSDLTDDQLNESGIATNKGTNIKIGNVNQIASCFFNSSNIASIEPDKEADAVVKVNGVFYSKDMTRLIKYDPTLTKSTFTIPDTVRYISPYAFYECKNLNNLVINSNIEEVGAEAFTGTRISYLYVDKNVTQIPGAISDKIIGDIKIVDGNDTLVWVDGVLFTSDMKTLVKYPSVLTNTSFTNKEYVVPDTVTTIRKDAFNNWSLRKITLPSGITEIPEHAFYKCGSLETVIAQGKIQSIGDYAFKDCPKYKGDIDLSEANYIGKYAFANCSEISGTLKIQDAEEIGAHAFENCTGITALELTNVKRIGAGAFAGCTGVTSIILNNVGTIEKDAFAEIAPKILHLGTSEMPEELKDKTENLTDFKADKDNTSVSDSAGVLFSDNGKTLIKYMDTTGQTSYTIPSTVERIGASAFRNQKTLKKVVLPDSVKEIGAYAFYGCSGLTDINIPESLQKIGAYAFYQCKGVKGKVTLPEILTIGEYAFYECSGITEIEIGKEGDSAAGRKIGDYSFAKCSNVGSIIFHGDAPDISSTAFQNVTGTFKYDSVGKGWSDILARLSAATIRISENVSCERAVALVVDCSGSMEGEPASALGTAIRTFCSGILDGSNDTQIMVIKYSDDTRTYGFTSNLDGILNYSAAYADGGTNTAAAIARAGACLDGIDAAEKDILIMSDGMPNNEADAVSEFKKLNPEYRVFSMGFFHSLSGSDLAGARSFMKKIQNMGYYEVSDISALNYAFKNTASTVKSPLKVTVTDSTKTVQNTGEAYVEVTVKGVMTNKSKDIINNIKGSLKVSDDTADLIQNRQTVKRLVPNQSAVATWTVKVPILPREQKYDYSVTVKADNMDATEFFGKLTIPAIDGNSITLEKDLMVNPEETVTIHAGIIATDYTPNKTNLIWSVQGQDSGTVKISNTKVTKISDYTYSASADITAAKEGTYMVTLKADNGTSDTTTLEVKDLFDIANCNITVPECTYNGKAQTPNPTVTRKDGANDLILANTQDYTVKYEDNKNVGKGTAVVTGAGKYHGTQSVKFNIVPSAVRNLRGDNKLSTETEAYAGAVRNMELAWDAPTENSLDGYVIWYGKDEKFKDYTEEILDKTEPKYSGDSLERATTYYAKVRAYKEVDGEKLLGEWSKVLTVKTGRQILVSEMWGFHNSRLQIKIGYFYRLFKNDPAIAELGYEDLGGKYNDVSFAKLNGICYAMVLTAAVIKDHKIPLDAYGISDLNAVNSVDETAEYKSNELNMTARDALIFAQLGQNFPANVEAKNKNKNKLGELYQAVKECQKGNGNPVTLSLQENGTNNHRILAVGITEDTEYQVKIAVYDPNRANDDKAELYLFRQSDGRFTGYSYIGSAGNLEWASQLNTAKDNKDYLSFDIESQGLIAQQLKSVDTVSKNSAFPNHTLVSATMQEKYNGWINKWDYGTPVDFETESEESGLCSKVWLADKNQTFTFEAVPEDAKISAATSNHSVTVTTTKQSDLSINVDETNANDISITSSEDGSFIVTFKDYTSLSKPAKETTVTVDCKAGVTTTIKQTEDSRIRLKGAESASYNRQEGVCDTETGLLKDASKEELKTPSLDSSKSYEISSDDSDVKLSASSKNDDVYDEVIKTTPAEDHSWDNGTVTKEPTCVAAGEKTYTCEICKETKTETIPATGEHAWGEWTVASKATIQAPEQQQRVCSICKKKETRSVGEKLQKPQTGNSSIPFTLNASSLKLKTKQKTTAFKVTSMPTGAYVSSVKSSNAKILKVMKFTKTGAITLKAQNKTGRAKLIITLSNGQSKQITVKVQKGAVRTTKIIGITKKITLKKGKKVKLKPAILPITSVEKITYKSSNSKVASVDSKGNIKARKKGKATITVKSGKKTVKCTITVK